MKCNERERQKYRKKRDTRLSSINNLFILLPCLKWREEVKMSEKQTSEGKRGRAGKGEAKLEQNDERPLWLIGENQFTKLPLMQLLGLLLLPKVSL